MSHEVALLPVRDALLLAIDPPDQAAFVAADRRVRDVLNTWARESRRADREKLPRPNNYLKRSDLRMFRAVLRILRARHLHPSRWPQDSHRERRHDG